MNWRHLLTVLAGTLLWGSTVDAAWVSWLVNDIDGPSGLGDAVVSRDGSLVEAANFGNASVTNVTVNTVPFTGVNFAGGGSPTVLTGLTYNTGQDARGTATGGAIDTLTDTIAFRSGADPQAASLTGLTPGTPYTVQFFLQHNTVDRTLAITSEGNTATLGTRNPGQVATGQFVADGATQDITFDANTGSQFLNGYQLREAKSTLKINIDDADRPIDALTGFTLPLGYRQYTGQGSVADYQAPFATDGTVGVEVDAPFYRNTRDDTYGNVTALDASGDQLKGFNAVMNSIVTVNDESQTVDIALTDLVAGQYDIKVWLHGIFTAGASSGTNLWNVSGSATATGIAGSVGTNSPSFGTPPTGLGDIASVTLPFAVGADGTASFEFSVNQLDFNQMAINGFELTYIAIPEPSTFLIWSLGPLGLAWFGRRRR